VTFHDHFSGHAAEYALARPRYPAALFDWLAGVAAARNLAWDCGTGNGQAAVALAEHFDHVVATDPSQEQLRNTERHPRVEYRQAAERDPLLREVSVDLVTVAQALHWFDPPAFFDEVRRVLRPAGVLAVWGYELATLSPQIDPLLEHFYRLTVGPYWPPQRALLERGYRSLEFPFAEIAAPEFSMEAQWTLGQFAAYLRTWSAVRRFIAARAADPVTPLEAALSRDYGEGERRVRFPLVLRVSRREAAS
jgi:SAM-dependent methyltransferase